MRVGDGRARWEVEGWRECVWSGQMRSKADEGASAKATSSIASAGVVGASVERMLMSERQIRPHDSLLVEGFRLEWS